MFCVFLNEEKEKKKKKRRKIHGNRSAKGTQNTEGNNCIMSSNKITIDLLLNFFLLFIILIKCIP